MRPVRCQETEYRDGLSSGVCQYQSRSDMLQKHLYSLPKCLHKDASPLLQGKLKALVLTSEGWQKRSDKGLGPLMLLCRQRLSTVGAEFECCFNIFPTVCTEGYHVRKRKWQRREQEAEKEIIHCQWVVIRVPHDKIAKWRKVITPRMHSLRKWPLLNWVPVHCIHPLATCLSLMAQDRYKAKQSCKADTEDLTK